MPIVVLGYIGCSAVTAEYDLNEFYQQVTWLSFSFTKHLKGGDESPSWVDKTVAQDIKEAYFKAGVKRPKCYRNMRNVFDGDLKIIFAHGSPNSQNSYYKIVATKIPYKACVRFLSRLWPQKLGWIHSLDGQLYETPVDPEKAAEVCRIHLVSGLSDIELYGKMPSQYTVVLPDGNEAGIYVFQPITCPCAATDFEITPHKEGLGNIFDWEGFESTNSIKKQ